MMREMDMAIGSLAIIGGLNWLAVASGKYDLIAAATGKRGRFGRTNVATRTIYGLFGGAALYSLARMIEREAF